MALALFSRWPAAVERIYAGWVAPGLSLVLTGVTRWIPVSIAELSAVAVGAWLVLAAALSVVRIPATERRPALVRATWRAFAAISVILLVFYGMWGLNYTRADLPTRLGWTNAATEPNPAEELAVLSDDLVAATNEAYLLATGSSDLGRPSTLSDAGATDLALEHSLAELSGELRWSRLNAMGRGPVKPVIASGVMSRLGISGVFFPLTGEANVNRFTPDSQLPLSMAHEKAHQRGITSEDEANFVGFLAAASSSDPYARYSALLFAQRQLLNELRALDEGRAADLVAARLPGVQRDVEDAAAYWRQFEGPPRRAQETINDTYLRLNGVDGGIESYQMSARLLVQYARQQGGTLVPHPARGPSGLGSSLRRVDGS